MSEEPMTDYDYQLTQEMITSLAFQILQLDLAGFLSRISTAEAIGPILDPTLYLKASKNLSDIERVASALYECQRKINKLRVPEVRG